MTAQPSRYQEIDAFFISPLKVGADRTVCPEFSMNRLTDVGYYRKDTYTNLTFWNPNAAVTKSQVFLGSSGGPFEDAFLERDRLNYPTAVPVLHFIAVVQTRCHGRVGICAQYIHGA